MKRFFLLYFSGYHEPEVSADDAVVEILMGKKIYKRKLELV